MPIFALSEPPCYEIQGTACRFVHDRLGFGETAAEITNWLVDAPLRIVLVVLIAWIVARLARRWIKRAVTRLVASPTTAAKHIARVGAPVRLTAKHDPRRQSRAQSISVVIENTVVAGIWTIALISVLGAIGIELGPLIAGAGIAGIALGFGAQSLVKDCIAGLFMLAEDHYGIGDFVDLGEAVGVVEEISLRATVLRGTDGTVWHVPNGVVQRVGNKTQLWSVAVLDIDVAYETDLEQARRLLQTAADEVCGRDELAALVIEAPVVLGVEALASDRVTLRLTVKVKPGGQWRLQRALREHIKSILDREGVEMPSTPRPAAPKPAPPSNLAPGS